MKDFLGKKVNVGDICVYAYSGYNTFTTGIVDKITKNNTVLFKKPENAPSFTKRISRYSNEIIKIGKTKK